MAAAVLAQSPSLPPLLAPPTAYGNIFSIVPTLLSCWFGAAAFGRHYAPIQVAVGLLALLENSTAGVIFDATDSWAPMCKLMAVSCGGGLVCAVALIAAERRQLVNALGVYWAAARLPSDSTTITGGAKAVDEQTLPGERRGGARPGDGGEAGGNGSQLRSHRVVRRTGGHEEAAVMSPRLVG